MFADSRFNSQHHSIEQVIRYSPLPRTTKHLLFQVLKYALEHPTHSTTVCRVEGEVVAEFGLEDWAYALKTERATLQQAIQHAEAIGLLRLDPIPSFKERYFLCWTPEGVARKPQPRRFKSRHAPAGEGDLSAQGEEETPSQHWKGRPPRHIWRQLREAVLARDDYTCHYCGTRSGRMTCDHQIPVSRGGSSTHDNLVTACLKCNSAKATRTAEEWVQTRSGQPRREVR
jgi:hypothetical protein